MTIVALRIERLNDRTENSSIWDIFSGVGPTPGRYFLCSSLKLFNARGCQRVINHMVFLFELQIKLYQ